VLLYTTSTTFLIYNSIPLKNHIGIFAVLISSHHSGPHLIQPKHNTPSPYYSNTRNRALCLPNATLPARFYYLPMQPLQDHTHPTSSHPNTPSSLRHPIHPFNPISPRFVFSPQNPPLPIRAMLALQMPASRAYLCTCCVSSEALVS